MCSICGVINIHEDSWDWSFEAWKRILQAGECRGTDATGYAYLDPEDNEHGIRYSKEPIPAREFVRHEARWDTIKTKKPRIIIGHNRAHTRGTPKVDGNNHPIIDTCGLALVHNGIVNAYGRTGTEYEKLKKWEVDTELIFRILEKNIGLGKTVEESIERSIIDLSGAQTCALIYSQMPNIVWLWAHQNPLHLLYIPEKDVIFFASTPDIVLNSVAEWKIYYDYFLDENVEFEYIINKASENQYIKIDANDSYKITTGKLRLSDYSASTSNYSSSRYDRNKDYDSWLGHFGFEEPEEKSKAVKQLPSGSSKTEIYVTGHGWMPMDEYKKRFVIYGAKK